MRGKKGSGSNGANGAFVVESGVPIPERFPKPAEPTFRQVLAELKPGQCVLVRRASKPKTAAIMVAAHTVLGKGKYAVRTSEEGVRVWRRA